MSFANNYLTKHKPFIPFIEEPPSGLLSFIVVIPVYLEDKILVTLLSLKNASLPKQDVEILIVVNYSVNDTDDNKLINQRIFNELLTWCRINSTDGIRFYPLLAADLPAKHAGAGLARKIGMDQALQRYNQIDRHDGLILSLDADTTIDNNYFKAIENNMFSFAYTNYGGCIIHFEHPIKGDEFSKEVYDAIIQYELHLLYYKYSLKFAGFPYYHYTIGSCFGVRAGYYAQQGGMNRKKGGEDFYFLHKLFSHKPFAFISETCVYPSPRPSTRVPFGTGPAIAKMVKNKDLVFMTYSPRAFIDLKALFEKLPVFYHSNMQTIREETDSLPTSIQEFISKNEFDKKIIEIKRNSASPETFLKRFYQWFNGFMVVKYLNYCHQGIYYRIPIVKAIDALIKDKNLQIDNKDPKAILVFFREFDKKKENL
jgi:hypothetical protein